MENSPTIFIVPTGIGCEVGGFAGDALPTAKLLASASGCLVTHPNVMNGGTLSEKDKNISSSSCDNFAARRIAVMFAIKFLWDNITPLGLPVVPDV